MKNKQKLTLELNMKIDNEALVELRKIRAAMDNAYDNNETIPFNLIQENFEFIVEKIKTLEESVGVE